MMRRYFIGVTTSSVAVTMAEFVMSSIFDSHTVASDYGWVLMSNLLLSAVLMLYVMGSNYVDARLAVAAFIIAFGLGSFNILIEALVFNVTDSPGTISALLRGFVKFAIMATILVLLDRRTDSVNLLFEPQSTRQWIWRIALCILLYVIVYISAGIILQQTLPALMEFYQGKIPPIGLIIMVQILRGLIFSLIAILFLRTYHSNPWIKAVILGLLFSVFGGIAPLIPPNDLMPVVIRVGHGFEVGISNFVYGLLVALILNRRRQLR